MKELTVDAILGNVDVVTDFVNAELESHDCSLRALTQIDIAIDEVFGNIASYAYAPDSGSATIQIEFIQDPLEAVITFRDSGKPYDPMEKKDPDITLSAEERGIGGLGIFMVKKIMDAVSYSYIDGQNVLTLHKRI